MNCGGTLLLYYIEDPTRTPDGFVKYTKVEERHLAEMKVYHSLPKTVDPEITSPAHLDRGILRPLHPVLTYMARRSNRPGRAGAGTVQVRGKMLPSSLGQLGAHRGGVQFPPAGPLRAAGVSAIAVSPALSRQADQDQAGDNGTDAQTLPPVDLLLRKRTASSATRAG